MSEVLEAPLAEIDFETAGPGVLIEQRRPDLGKVSQRRPPKDGPCKRCGRERPLNRLFLCYPCWVKTVLEDKGWRDGLPHPTNCDCEIPGVHGRPLS